MSSSITIQWTDGVSTNKVEQVVGKYEKIDRCETGVKLQEKYFQEQILIFFVTGI